MPPASRKNIGEESTVENMESFAWINSSYRRRIKYHCSPGRTTAIAQHYKAFFTCGMLLHIRLSLQTSNLCIWLHAVMHRAMRLVMEILNTTFQSVITPTAATKPTTTRLMVTIVFTN